jgi:hypothetical protein
MAMAMLLLFALAGGVIRTLAPDPSTLRDFGSLLLVLWLPAVGNLIAYLVKKIPRGAPRVTEFAQGAPFAPQLQAHIRPVPLPEGALAAIDPSSNLCTLLVGRHGFTARLPMPVRALLASPQVQTVALELLRPQVALRKLPPGTAFHLLAGTAAVASGQVA